MLTQEQLEIRKTGIGGSEVAAVLGLSPWARPIDVWRAKVEGRILEETLPMRRGRLLEPAVCQWYAEDTGAELEECGTLRHPKSKVLLATPDRLARMPDGGVRVLEAKTANFRMLQHWGDAGTDDVPDYYLVQVAAEMGCAALPAGDLAVLIAGDDFRIFHLQRDLELEAMILDGCERFWRDYVVTGKPPPPDSSDRYADWLKERYPESSGPMLAAPPGVERWVEQLRIAREAAAHAEQAETEARNHLVSLIGDADGMEGDGWRITNRSVKGRAKTDWEAVAKAAGASEKLIQQHTNRGAGYRRFLPTFKE